MDHKLTNYSHGNRRLAYRLNWELLVILAMSVSVWAGIIAVARWFHSLL